MGKYDKLVKVKRGTTTPPGPSPTAPVPPPSAPVAPVPVPTVTPKTFDRNNQFDFNFPQPGRDASRQFITFTEDGMLQDIIV